MRRNLILSALSSAWLLSSIGAAHASCVVPPPIEQAIEEAQVVFVGTVVDLGADERQAIVEVESVWKGEGVATVVAVDGGFDPNGATSVDRHFEPGVRYIFFPTTEEVPFLDAACTSTQQVTADIEALRPESATNPVDGETVTFGPTGAGDPEVAGPPVDDVGFGSEEEPAVPAPMPVDPLIDDVAEPEPGRRVVTSASEVDGVADSYLLPMLLVGLAVALGIGGLTFVRRFRNEPIE